MERRILFLLLSIVSSFSLYAYKTEPLSEQIHTIQVLANGNWANYPIIELNSNEYIQISFDRIYEGGADRLRYRVIHCNADWVTSSLSSIEYIDGFNDNLIEDYAYSSGTTMEYTNYQLIIPNNDVRLTVSGNYTVEIYEEDNPDSIMLTACFSVLDRQISVQGEMMTNTLIDANRAHQQVSFTIDHPRLRIADPMSDLRIYVRQNQRMDNQKKDIKPTIVQTNRLIYNQNRNLIFEAGNEYRRFDMPSARYNGMRVFSTRYAAPYYYLSIVPDKIRANTRYIYDEDQNGRYIMRNDDGVDSSTDGDYFFVNFRLEAEYPFNDNVYINGNFTYDTFNDLYMLKYDYNEKVYYATLMLKQGLYNYQYLVGAKGNYSTAPAEGNYYETENEYQVLVYYRPPGQRHDSFIGFMYLRK